MNPTHAPDLDLLGCLVQHMVNLTKKIQAEEVVSGSLLPALTMIPANVGLAHEIWSVLECLPYTTRFRLYLEWQVRS